MLSICRQSSQLELTSAVVSPGAMLANRFLPNAECGLTEVGFAAIDCCRCGAMSCSSLMPSMSLSASPLSCTGSKVYGDYLCGKNRDVQRR